MRKTAAIAITITAILLALSACSKRYDELGVPTDAPLVDAYRLNSINKAIVTQRAVYPYHFMENSAEINKLGEYDLKILAAYFEQHPGDLSVRRGGASDDLYQARVETVSCFLTEAGVEVDAVNVVDALPGGEGMTSEEVFSKVKDMRKRSSKGKNMGSAASGSSSPLGTGK